MAPNGSREEGNTNSSLTRIPASKYWAWTYFYPDDKNIEKFGSIVFTNKNWKWVYGDEICPDTGRKHLQGYIDFGKKTRPTETIKYTDKIHWEKCKGNKLQNVNYCTKDKKYYTNMKIRRPIYDVLEGKELKPFQQEIKDLHNRPEDHEDRYLYWYWEPDGKVGKTVLAKHLCIKYPDEVLFVSGKGADIKCAVKSFLENPDNDLKTVIFYFTKTLEDYVSYTAIEEVKDGIFFSGKYESGMSLFNSPNVICFANFEPNVNSLSSDRWRVKKII